MLAGVYLHDGFIYEPKEECPFYWDMERWKRYIDHLAFCGIGLMEFCTQAAFLRIPSTDFERGRIRTMQAVIRYAHEKNIQVWNIISSNALSRVPEGELPVDQRDAAAYHEPCPRNAFFRERMLKVTEYFVTQYREADGFEVFAGDWGGCTCGVCDYTTWMELAGDYAAIVKRVAPNAAINLNTWCVSYWSSCNPNEDPWPEMFAREAKTSALVAKNMEKHPGLGLTLPFHHLYRPLAMDGRTPEECPPWPERVEINSLQKGGHPVYAWPHFVMENDPFHIGRWGLFNARVRYIADVVRRLHARGVNGTLGNLYNPVRQPLSAYAFGRLCARPDTPVESILLGFASLVAEESSRDALYRVLLYMENTDPWQQDLAPAARQPQLAGAPTAGEAAALLQSVQPKAENAFLAGNQYILSAMAETIRTLQKPLEGEGLY